MMRSIRSTASPHIPMAHLVWLKQFAFWADMLFFHSALKSRVNLSMSPSRALIDTHGAWGATWSKRFCTTHRQVHCARIVIDPYHYPGESHEVWWNRLLWILTHELCHAFLKIFTHRGNFSLDDFLQVHGIGGHGTAFQALSDTIVSVLSSENVLSVDFDTFCGCSVRRDEATMRLLQHQANWLYHESQPWNTVTVRKLLRDRLNMSKHRADRYEKRFREQCTPLELLLHLYETVWPGNYRSFLGNP